MLVTDEMIRLTSYVMERQILADLSQNIVGYVLYELIML